MRGRGQALLEAIRNNQSWHERSPTQDSIRFVGRDQRAQQLLTATPQASQGFDHMPPLEPIPDSDEEDNIFQDSLLPHHRYNSTNFPIYSPDARSVSPELLGIQTICCKKYVPSNLIVGQPCQVEIKSYVLGTQSKSLKLCLPVAPRLSNPYFVGQQQQSQ